ncbi:MAG TPA: zf-HC2 domain-containing protein [Longimicrobiaceae bacterium]|nr:zf-HC2 domain-containing protein [Longimicrobiaceae bacterium]
MLNCSDFLEGYSDFRDGLLPAARYREFERHAETCDACARYHRVIGGGVEAFRSLPDVEPSEDFEWRLRHRLLLLEEEQQRQASGSGASAAVTIGIALAIGASAWLPALRARQAVVRLPPVVALAPAERSVIGNPFPSAPPLPAPTLLLPAPRFIDEPLLPPVSRPGDLHLYTTLSTYPSTR